MLLLITLLGLGCTFEDQDRFNGGGTSVDPTTTEDTGGGDDTGDSQGQGDAFAVVQVEAGFEDLPNVGIAIYVFAEVVGAPGPLDGGLIQARIDGQPVQAEGFEGIPIDNSLAWVVPDSGEVFTALSVPDTGSYELELQILTADGDSSEPWSGTVDSPNERELPPKP